MTRNTAFYDDNKGRNGLRFGSVALSMLLLIGGAAAIEVQDLTPRNAQTGIQTQLMLWLRAEKNYSAQRVSFTLTSDFDVLFKGCNSTTTDTFSINRKGWAKVNTQVLFSRPGTYKVRYNLENSHYNQTGETTITVSGPSRNIKESCTQAVGHRREKYGQGQPSPVKDRIKNTIRKYAVW